MANRPPSLDDQLVSPRKKAEYQQMLSRVPPVPLAEQGGHQVLAPAANCTTGRVKEIPELYPVFPYDRYGLGRDGFDMAREMELIVAEFVRIRDSSRLSDFARLRLPVNSR